MSFLIIFVAFYLQFIKYNSHKNEKTLVRR